MAIELKINVRVPSGPNVGSPGFQPGVEIDSRPFSSRRDEINLCQVFRIRNRSSVSHVWIKNVMPNTYTQIHIQAVFAVKFRAAMLNDIWREEFHRYVSGIITNQGHKMISINSVPDHVHLFFGMRPVQSLSDLM
jgi:hypothetical protein